MINALEEVKGMLKCDEQLRDQAIGMIASSATTEAARNEWRVELECRRATCAALRSVIMLIEAEKRNA